MNQKHEELGEKIMADANEALDKLILERMAMNEPLVVERKGRIRNVSPFILAKERWAKDFLKKWRQENRR